MLLTGNGDMELLQIDENKCKKDGLCAAECPPAIIKLEDKESFPRMVFGAPAAKDHLEVA